MRDILVYGTEIAVGLACGVGGVVLLRRHSWILGAILMAMCLSAVGHAAWALMVR